MPDLYCYKAKMTRMIDGDTVDVDIDLGFHLAFSVRARLHGINAPELRGESKEKGIVARNRLQEMVLGADDIVVRTFLDEKDKYGRVLVEVLKTYRTQAGDELSLVNINERLVEEGLAVKAVY